MLNRGHKVCTIGGLEKSIRTKYAKLKGNLVSKDLFACDDGTTTCANYRDTVHHSVFASRECTGVLAMASADRSEVSEWCALVPVGDPVVSLTLAQPVSPEYELAFGFWIQKMKEDGTIDSLPTRRAAFTFPAAVAPRSSS